MTVGNGINKTNISHSIISIVSLLISLCMHFFPNLHMQSPKRPSRSGLKVCYDDYILMYLGNIDVETIVSYEKVKGFMLSFIQK